MEYQYKAEFEGKSVLAKDEGCGEIDNKNGGCNGEVCLYVKAKFCICGKEYAGRITYDFDWLVEKMVERHGEDIKEAIDDDFSTIDYDLWPSAIYEVKIDNYYDDGDSLKIDGDIWAGIV